MTSRRPLLVVLSLLLPAAIVVFSACSDQAEGERCDTRASRNGSDDCQAGLTCLPASDLGSGGSTYCSGVTTCGVCCPDDRTQATVNVCALSTSLPGADAAAPVVTDSGDEAGDDDDADAADAQGMNDAADGSDAADAADGGDAGDADGG